VSLDDGDEKVVRKLDALGVLPGMRATVASNRSGITLRTADQDIIVSQVAAGRVRCVAR